MNARPRRGKHQQPRIRNHLPHEALIGKVAGAFSGGAAARTMAGPAGDNWEEF
jgi:methyl-accepting chemotaxis protein